MSDAFFAGATGASIADVHAIFDSDLPVLVAELVSMGILVSIGSTRDRGAISIGITMDGKRRREYFRDSPAATDFLRSAVESLGGPGVGVPLSEAHRPPPPSRGRQKAS